ncbi:hypothetical protein R3P38DRAFT_3262410 [Favolaschia claudopus]|uniref:Uncharacterized protein n=1 Tax=Favolaschia claudopus TaxID=2862362 RepID=A0AAW0CHK6_9AGAR
MSEIPRSKSILLVDVSNTKVEKPTIAFAPVVRPGPCIPSYAALPARTTPPLPAADAPDAAADLPTPLSPVSIPLSTTNKAAKSAIYYLIKYVSYTSLLVSTNFRRADSRASEVGVLSPLPGQVLLVRLHDEGDFTRFANTSKFAVLRARCLRDSGRRHTGAVRSYLTTRVTYLTTVISSAGLISLSTFNLANHAGRQNYKLVLLHRSTHNLALLSKLCTVLVDLNDLPNCIHVFLFFPEHYLPTLPFGSPPFPPSFLVSLIIASL